MYMNEKITEPSVRDEGGQLPFTEQPGTQRQQTAERPSQDGAVCDQQAAAQPGKAARQNQRVKPLPRDPEESETPQHASGHRPSQSDQQVAGSRLHFIGLGVSSRC